MSVLVAHPRVIETVGKGWVSTPTPRISWAVESETSDWFQARATITVTRSGKPEVHTIEGRQSQQVAWPFSPLLPRESFTLSVTVYGADGSVSEETAPVEYRASHRDGEAWSAQTIALNAPEREAQPFRARYQFDLALPVIDAVLYTTAHGVYSALINGMPQDDQFLKPGWTAYNDRVVFDTTDVSTMLHEGSNEILVDVAGGWFTERFGFQGFAKPYYGTQPAFSAILVLTLSDGSVQIHQTDSSWEVSAQSPFADCSIYRGEKYDARVNTTQWTAPALTSDISDPWVRVSPEVRSTETVRPVRIFVSPSGKTLVDFGQNLVGVIKLATSKLRGGQTVTLRHAEVLENGELGVRPLRHADATDTYTHVQGAPDYWHPTFTFHGFQFAEVEGWDGPLELDDLEALVIHSDLRRTGYFESSHDLLNRLHTNVIWGMRGNFLSVPTDCPQRDERLGWTGDIQAFSPTASFLFDTEMFLDSWLTDLDLEQKRGGTGVVPIVIPNVVDSAEVPKCAWGDASTIVPAVMRERFGNTAILERQLNSMIDWVDAIINFSTDEWLWEGYFQFGDWLDPTAPPSNAEDAKTDSDIVATAHAYRSSDLLVQAAQLVGRDDVAEKYTEVRENFRSAFLNHYVTPAGRIMSDSQTAYAMAVVYGIVQDPVIIERMRNRLAELVRLGGYHIATGFVGTPIVQDALGTGEHILASDSLMFQTENPSWLYPVTMGATTIWERWDSMLEDGSINPGEMTSFNHYALGAVADWLHRKVAGLAPSAPGYEMIEVNPIYLPTLDYARASYESGYGTISTGWTRSGDKITLQVVVPANVTATIALPDGTVSVGSGEHEWTFVSPRVDRPATKITLQSSLAEVIDNRKAYSALLEGLNSVDPEAAVVWRKNSRWSEKRTLQDSLHATPRAAVEAALTKLAQV